MTHYITCAELKLIAAGENDAFAKAAALLDSGQIGPHRFWWLATQFAIEALTAAAQPSEPRAAAQRDLFQ